MKKINLFLLIILSFFIFNGCKNKEQKKLYIYNWSYFIAPDVVSAFEKKYNVKVVYNVFDSNQEMFTNIRIGLSDYDIIFPSGDYVSIMIKEKMLAKIDKNKVPNIKYISKEITDKIYFDKGNKYSIPYMVGGTGVAVNKKFLKEYPRDNSIFEMDILQGKFTLLDDPREVMGHALKTLGYSVNSINKNELVKAKNLVLKWKRNSLGFDSNNFAKKFAAEELWVVQCYAENVIKEFNKSQIENVDFFIPSSGGPMYMDSMVILKGSKNKDLAHKFINFIHEPEQYAKIIDYLGYPPINFASAEIITKKPNYSFEDIKKCEFIEDLGTGLDLYDMLWEEIMVRN